jgi:hypothetical protein
MSESPVSNEQTEERPDGFRKRRKRPKGWYEKAIKDGSVRAPGAPDPDEGKERTGVVVNVPLAQVGVDGKQDS